MTLTKEDLLALSTMMDEKLEPIHNEINDVKVEIKGMKTEIAGMQVEIKGMKTEIASMQVEIERMKTEIAGIQVEIEGIKTEIAGMQAEIKGIKTEIEGMKQRITVIELRIENELVRNINFIAENVIPAAKKYEREAEKIESMQADIDVMKGVLKEHSKILQNIS